MPQFARSSPSEDLATPVANANQVKESEKVKITQERAFSLPTELIDLNRQLRLAVDALPEGAEKKGIVDCAASMIRYVGRFIMQYPDHYTAVKETDARVHVSHKAPSAGMTETEVALMSVAVLAEGLASAVKCEGVYVLLHDPISAQLVQVALGGPGAMSSAGRKVRIPLTHSRHCAVACLQSGIAVNVTDNVLKKSALDHYSAIAVPISTGRKVSTPQGVVLAATKYPVGAVAFTRYDESVMFAQASQIATSSKTATRDPRERSAGRHGAHRSKLQLCCADAEGPPLLLPGPRPGSTGCATLGSRCQNGRRWARREEPRHRLRTTVQPQVEGGGGFPLRLVDSPRRPCAVGLCTRRDHSPH